MQPLFCCYPSWGYYFFFNVLFTFRGSCIFLVVFCMFWSLTFLFETFLGHHLILAICPWLRVGNYWKLWTSLWGYLAGSFAGGTPIFRSFLLSFLPKSLPIFCLESEVWLSAFSEPSAGGGLGRLSIQHVHTQSFNPLFWSSMHVLNCTKFLLFYPPQKTELQPSAR